MTYTTRAAAAQLWLRPYNEPAGAAGRSLICLPHAGGTANTYEQWPAFLPPDLAVYAVQYPGRQDRFAEPPASAITTMAEQIADAVEPLAPAPLTIFGHSMGAYVAYEVTAELERRRRTTVEMLVVSGVTAPHHKQPSAVYTLPDADFTDEVASGNAAFAELLATPDLVEVLLPMIRADYRIFEEYQPANPPTLRAPVLATGGSADPGVDRGGLASWADLTTGGFEVLTFPGGHFYLAEDEAAVVSSLASRVPA